MFIYRTKMKYFTYMYVSITHLQCLFVQGVWDSELQNIFPMGFDSNPSANLNQGPNGN